MSHHRLLLTSLLMLAMCATEHAQEPSPVPRDPDRPATGTIEGKVVNEMGQPLAGAILFLRGRAASVIVRNATSDLEGNFRVSGLEPALYTISATAPAYTSAIPDPDAPVYYRIGDSARVELIRGGAITGTVTNSLGEPLISVRVRATMIRTAHGEPPKSPFVFGEKLTDDRGIYRIYGLAPGTYLVSAGGSGISSMFNPYEGDAATFAPSATRDNASEVVVRTGEDTNVDIRYRGEPGHTISGTVKSVGGTGATIMLTTVGGDLHLATAFQMPGARGFAFGGISDGDYELSSQEMNLPQSSSTPSFNVSETKRVTVRGADVTGVELVTQPPGTISGRIVHENSKVPECKGKRSPLHAETLIEFKQPDSQEKEESIYHKLFINPTVPDATGAFTLRNLRPGRYQLQPRFYARYWYLQSIISSATSGKPQKIDAAARWTTVKAGEQVSNLTITLAEGAASLRGQTPLAEGAVVPAGKVVFLIPQEADKTEDVLRFFVTSIAADGTFAFDHLPPGKYLMLAEADPDPQVATQARLRQPEAASARAKMRRSAEAVKTELDLKPCQNLTKYQLMQ